VLLQIALVVFLIALYFSYTRAAWLSIIGALGVYLLFYFKISFKWIALVLSVITIGLIINSTEINYLLQKNNAEHTTENFSERLESMSNISSDASNLERFNRWNCAIKLFKERPVFGWGPGTYSFVYSPFQDASDLTIISTNFGNGGNAHSEYLGPLAEQGFVGMILMVLLLVCFFYRASWLYINTKNQSIKTITMMVLLSLVTYFSHGILNNYLDTDKASVPIWAMMAIFVALDCYHSKNVLSKK
jgi:O-antigen ligase